MRILTSACSHIHTKNYPLEGHNVTKDTPVLYNKRLYSLADYLQAPINFNKISFEICSRGLLDLNTISLRSTTNLLDTTRYINDSEQLRQSKPYNHENIVIALQ